MTQLYRVFNDNWNNGGRFYGGWWQQVKKRDVNHRSHIQISGEPIVEEDYAQLHPRLLYRYVGKELKGDAYELPGWGRGLCKKALNILINAATERAAIGAIANEIGGESAHAKACQLISELKARHKPIAKFFHSKIGCHLQRIDSDMAEKVMLTLLKQGTIPLPIHDSFLVPKKHQQSLLEAMNDAYQEAA